MVDRNRPFRLHQLGNLDRIPRIRVLSGCERVVVERKAKEVAQEREGRACTNREEAEIHGSVSMCDFYEDGRGALGGCREYGRYSNERTLESRTDKQLSFPFEGTSVPIPCITTRTRSRRAHLNQLALSLSSRKKKSQRDRPQGSGSGTHPPKKTLNPFFSHTS
jgi:hypothetical protein